MPWGAEFLIDAAAEPERGARRRELRLAVDTNVPGELAQVVVHNLSATGLLIETLSKLDKGDSFEVVLPEAGQRAARVVWTSGDFYGCQFANPISEGSVSAALLRAPPPPRMQRTPVDQSTTMRPTEALRIEQNPLDPGDLSSGAKLAIVVSLNLALWSILVAVGAMII